MIERLAELRRRLWYFLNRSRFERELREEMAAHRAMTGEAGPRFGNELRLREEAADAWGWGWLERLQQDVRFGLRLLRRSPAFTLTAVLVLALGIGVNLAAFQVFDAVALSWLPVRSPESLVNLTRRNPRGSGTSFSYPEFVFYRDQSRSFASAFAIVYGSVEIGDTKSAGAEFVSASYFTDLGARPLAGRLFDPGDERTDAVPVVLLAERFWRTRLGADPAAVGRTIAVNRRPFTIAGVVPDAFSGLHGRNIVAWMPITQHAAAFTGSTLVDDWSAHGAVGFYARLRNAAGLATAQAELAPLAAELHRQRPNDSPEGEWIELHPAGTYLPLDTSNAMALAMVGSLILLVLVAACMNLGVLVLARTLGRDREFALRVSVGASRGRILRQLLTEHLLLGAAGAAAGCFVAWIATRALAIATDMPAGIAPHLTVRSAAVATALAILSSLVFGLTPALQAIKPAASKRMRLRSVLVAVEVAAAGVLLIVSGLLVRGLTRATQVSLGFDYTHTLVADSDLGAHGMQPAEAREYWRRVESRVRDVPGVVQAAVTSLPPFGNRMTTNRERTVFYYVTASYFETMRIPLRRGRLFRDDEKDVALVGEALARKQWPGADPIGQKYDDATVIGVVGDARTVLVGEPGATECYHPNAQRHMSDDVMVVRVDGAPRDFVATIAGLARAEGTGLTPDVQPLGDAFESKLKEPRQVATIASMLGICALLLAVTGLGGMIAYTVSQRMKEIGVRVALGARPGHVVAAIVRQFRAPLVCGALAGSALAAGVGTVLSREMFGVSQFDPLAHGGSLLLFALVAACAVAPSLRRALRVDPVTTLRHE
jgi:predicted permease